MSKTRDVEFKAGDSAYYKKYYKKGKLDMHRRPYYEVVEKTDAISYKLEIS